MKYTNKSNLPKSLEDAISKNTYDLSRTNQNIFSVTTILNPPKVRQLSVRHWSDLKRDISDSIWLLLGSSVHSVMERICGKNRLIEERMYIDTDTWDIVDKKKLDPKKIYVAGKPDLYDANENVVEDFKVTSVYTIIFGRSEWEEQLNCYAWQYRKLGFPVEKLRIVALLRDWSRTKALQERDYPKTAAVPINIKLWDEQKQLNFIKERLSLHLKYRNTADDEIPPCSKEERWAKDSKYAVMKKGRKTAIKLFDEQKKADALCKALNFSTSNMKKPEKKRDVFNVDHRKGEDVRCKHYCDVNGFCNYYKQTYQRR